MENFRKTSAVIFTEVIIMPHSVTDNTLKEIQKQEFDILCELRRICGKHGLTYYITAGTLLGAVRHGGFIPWDDDIDVAMPVKDFRHFAKLCRSELDGQFFFQDCKSDRHYPFHFAKIRKHNTEVYDPFLRNLDIHKGLYIDIFPLVKCPNSEAAAKRFFKAVEFITYSIMAKYDKSFVCGYSRVSVRTAFTLSEKLPKRLLVFLRGAICYFAEMFCDGEMLCTVSGAHGYPREAYRSEWFRESVKLNFEGEEFCAPVGWHDFLTNMYGDYMTPPAQNERAGHFKQQERSLL